MEEICKDCGSEMEFAEEIDDDSFTLFKYICTNEDCPTQPTLVYQVCQSCEHEESYWEK